MMAESLDTKEPVRLAAEGHICFIETLTRGVADRLRDLTETRRGLILLDRAFEGEADAWESALPGFRVLFTRRPGEEAKTLDEARLILEALAREKLARDDWLIVRGGGSLTDLGAFCAGLYRRGLKLILVATTILGAVDAAVGGKTAVNFAGAKNQIGHFYLPQWVLVDLESFRTLPEVRRAEGLVEAYKTGLLFDPDLAALVERDLDALMAGDSDRLAEVIHRSYAAKAALVELDFREEKGIRDILNLGHTYGHVLESYYSPELSHGRAVAFGLAAAADFSWRRGWLSKNDMARVIETAGRLGRPWPALPPEQRARELLTTDKKIRGDKLRFVVLEELGRPRLIEASADDVLRSAQAVE